MPATNEPQPTRRMSLPDQARSLATILREEFGVPFRIFESNDGALMPSDDPSSRNAEPSREERAWALEFGARERASVLPSPGGSYRLALSLHEGGRPGLVALGVKASVARPLPDAIQEETVRLEKWLRAVFD